jgi:hypothetical protein
MGPHRQVATAQTVEVRKPSHPPVHRMKGRSSLGQSPVPVNGRTPRQEGLGGLCRSVSLGALTIAGFAAAPVSLLAQASGPTTQPEQTNVIRQMESIQREQASRQKQNEAAVTSQAPESDVPETYPGENADLGPQMLLKQKAPQRKPLFEFSNDTMFSWTSNALSTPHNRGNERQDTGTVAETFSLAIAPEPISLDAGKLALRAGYRHLFFFYDVTDGSAPLNLQNFQMSSFFLGANLTFKENWNASLGLDYNRLLFSKRPWNLLHRPLDPSNWSEGYTEFKPTWSLSRNIALLEKLNLSVSYSGAYHFSHTDPISTDTEDFTKTADNFENSASLSLMWAPVDKLLFIPSCRFTHYLYTRSQRLGGRREDRTLSPSITAMYSISQRISLRVSLGGDFRHSSQPENSGVRKFDTGVGASFTLKF